MDRALISQKPRHEEIVSLALQSILEGVSVLSRQGEGSLEHCASFSRLAPHTC